MTDQLDGNFILHHFFLLFFYFFLPVLHYTIAHVLYWTCLLCLIFIQKYMYTLCML